MVKVNEKGLCLHNSYAYPAFASVPEKYKDILPFLEKNMQKIENWEKLKNIYSDNCAYLLWFVHAPFEINKVREYWLGGNNKSHTSMKFRDWMNDNFMRDVLKNLAPEHIVDNDVEPDYMIRRSRKCDISELNNCTIIKAKVIDSQNYVVAYEQYSFQNNKLSLISAQRKIIPLFKEPVSEGDIIAIHHGYGIERIVSSEDYRLHFIKAFNERDVEMMHKLIPMDKRYISEMFKLLK